MTTSTNPITEKILNKIKKLSKSQESFEKLGSIEEANVFAAKIQDLLLQYNLSLGDVPLEERGKDVIEERLEHTINSVGGFVFMEIMRTIAKHNFCRVYKHWDIKSKQRLIIIGSKENVDVCKYILSSIMPTFKKVGTETFNRIKSQGYNKGLDTFLRSYYTGCGKGLDAKLTEEKKVSIAKNSEVSGLMVINDQVLVNYVAENWGKVVKTNKKIKLDSAFAIGLSTGRNIQINKGLNNQSKPISRKLLS
jgi:hypothetical protein